MTDLVLTTYDWVPDFPRGYVRDLRIRWALEEAELPYRVDSVPIRDKGPDHFAHQPFGQVPWLTHGDNSIFESGAILLYLGEMSPALMPTDRAGRFRVTEWVLAALNSVEMAVLPWSLYQFSNDTAETQGRQQIEGFLKMRLGHMEKVLSAGEWLAGSFSVADIAMSDVLRLADRFDALAPFPACRSYVERAKTRPAFIKAYNDQMAHFAAAD